MALYFENVKLLKYDHTPVIFEAGLRYKIEKHLTITGEILDKTSESGVYKLITKEDLILAGATDYDDIYLNNVFFGKGKIVRMGFGGGTLVRRESYTYEIICFEDGDLFNAVAGVYAGLTWTNARIIDQLSESFNYGEDEEGNKTYNHSISVRFNEKTVPQNQVLAKALAAVFFNATSGLGAYLGQYDLTGIKRFYTESYSMVDGSASFNESAEILSHRTDNYSYSFSYDMQQDEQGWTNITEKASIEGLAYPKAVYAKAGYDALIGAVYSRTNAVYQAYGFSTQALFTEPLSKVVLSNQFEGKMEFQHTFSNNPKYKAFAVWEYSIRVERSEQNVFNVSEDGNIVGIGKIGSQKYNNALSYWNTVKAGIDARLQTAYQNAGGTRTLITVGQSFTKNEFQGKISYSRLRTDDNLYVSGGFRKKEIRVNISAPVHLTQKYNVFNYKEIVQTQQQVTPGKASVNVRLKGIRGATVSDYLAEAQSLAAPYTALGTDSFLANASYSLNPRINDFNITLEYSFLGSYRAIDDITLT